LDLVFLPVLSLLMTIFIKDAAWLGIGVAAMCIHRIVLGRFSEDDITAIALTLAGQELRRLGRSESRSTLLISYSETVRMCEERSKSFSRRAGTTLIPAREFLWSLGMSDSDFKKAYMKHIGFSPPRHLITR
jgi:hypothetical protein